MGSFSSFFVKGIIDTATQHGCDKRSLLRRNKLSEDNMSHPSYRIDTKIVLELINDAIVDTGNPALGLYIGESVRPASFSALGYTIMSSRNLEEAIDLNKKYGSLVANYGTVIVDKKENYVETHLRCEDYPAELVRPLSEAFITAWWVFSKWIIGQDTKLIKLDFSHKCPSYLDEYQRIFKCTPNFEQHSNSLTFDPAYLDTPILEFDPDVCSIMKRKTTSLLANIKTNSDICSEVASQIEQLLPVGKANLTSVAEKLNLSERVLRRRLQDKGSSFQAILNQIRQTIAITYLSDPNHPIKNISLTLGYNEQSTFTNAFKKWTGLSPSEYREQALVVS